MQTYDLGGTWTVRKREDSEAIPATVPGCIHTDLLTAGTIEDPYYRDNESQQMWIGETDWVYTRTFHVDQKLLNHERVMLHCDGLDTLTTITINGMEIGSTSNQFRIWEFDVKSQLQTGENTIEITFTSTIPYINAEQEKRYLNLTGVGHHRIDGSNRVRKSQCNYGWDWGPMCATAGIWRPISLVAFDTARLKDVHIMQDHSQSGAVKLDVSLTLEQLVSSTLDAKISVLYRGDVVAQAEIAISGTKAQTSIMLENPKLWWPNGLGEQPLYDVSMELFDQETLLDTKTTRIGLRTLELDRHDDEWGESFQFVVNGVPFFAKGANWIPADTFVTRISDEQYADLIKSAADANMNMLRVWGGGIYEPDVFYDLCDRYGICVWQDFMFACSAYPAFDDAFMETVKHEVEDNVKRLRHHPSIALWCGNNEIEQIAHMFVGDPQEGKMTWEEYRALFDELIPGVVHAHDPQRPYWPSSPHSPVGDRGDFNNPRCGDAHLWSVWHGRQPFEWYRTCEHRFNSEFGFQSFPEPEVVATYTQPEDRNVTSFIMEHHQRSQIGNDAIIQYMLSWFKLPTSFDMTLWLSQILHGIGMKYAVEHWRRSMPRGMGTLYWQINDCWPVASWASIDYFGNWKALHYLARRFFAPILMSAIEDPKTGSVEVHITNDLREPTNGILKWQLTDTAGRLLAQNTLDCAIKPLADTKVMGLHFADHLAEHGPRHLLLWIDLIIDDKVVSQDTVFFIRPKHLELQTPEFSSHIDEQPDGAFAVTITTSTPALWVWPDLPGIKATYSDRFFHLHQDTPVTVTIRPKAPMSRAEFEQALQINSLVDTWK
jgi:beta-mannosidase